MGKINKIYIPTVLSKTNLFNDFISEKGLEPLRF